MRCSHFISVTPLPLPRFWRLLWIRSGRLLLLGARLDDGEFVFDVAALGAVLLNLPGARATEDGPGFTENSATMGATFGFLKHNDRGG